MIGIDQEKGKDVALGIGNKFTCKHSVSLASWCRWNCISAGAYAIRDVYLCLL